MHAREWASTPGVPTCFSGWKQPAKSKTLPAVAGLKGHVPAEQLQGSHAVAILNLKPAKLAGMASEAMLLAADAPKEDGTELVRVLVPPGQSSFLSMCFK